jgi:hypothetical protein
LSAADKTESTEPSKNGGLQKCFEPDFQISLSLSNAGASRIEKARYLETAKRVFSYGGAP